MSCGGPHQRLYSLRIYFQLLFAHPQPLHSRTHKSCRPQIPRSTCYGSLGALGAAHRRPIPGSHRTAHRGSNLATDHPLSRHLACHLRPGHRVGGVVWYCAHRRPQHSANPCRRTSRFNACNNKRPVTLQPTPTVAPPRRRLRHLQSRRSMIDAQGATQLPGCIGRASAACVSLSYNLSAIMSTPTPSTRARSSAPGSNPPPGIYKHPKCTTSTATIATALLSARGTPLALKTTATMRDVQLYIPAPLTRRQLRLWRRLRACPQTNRGTRRRSWPCVRAIAPTNLRGERGPPCALSDVSNTSR